MKKILTILLCSVLYSYGNAQTTKWQTVYSKDFSKDHKEWVLTKDTLVIDTLIGFKDIQVPVKIVWVIGTDPADKCLHVAYFRLEKLDNPKIQISELKTTKIGCGTKFESPDKRRFDSLIFTGKYESKKNGKPYIYTGKLGQVYGNGEFNVFDLIKAEKQ